jgi:hypothetical protein
VIHGTVGGEVGRWSLGRENSSPGQIICMENEIMRQMNEMDGRLGVLDHASQSAPILCKLACVRYSGLTQAS